MPMRGSNHGKTTFGAQHDGMRDRVFSLWTSRLRQQIDSKSCTREERAALLAERGEVQEGARGREVQAARKHRAHEGHDGDAVLRVLDHLTRWQPSRR